MNNLYCTIQFILTAEDHTAQLTPTQDYSESSLTSKDALELIVQASIPKVGTNFICFTLGAGQGSPLESPFSACSASATQPVINSAKFH